MCSKTHTAPIAPMVLHCTRIGKYAEKKFGINGQCGINFFFIVIDRFSLVKAAMNAPRVCTLGKNCLPDIDKCAYTVSWWIRILYCIEEVPQVHFSIQFKFPLDFFNWCQLEFKLRIDVEI
jgi:hypothetical protein